jgi:DNA-binding SARP family transcriptional activator/LysM repeat protein
MRKYAAGLGSLLALLVIVAGVPVVLLAVAGNPFPTAVQWNSIITLAPDYGNVILIGTVLPLIGWVAWAFFAIPMLIEVIATITGHTTRKHPPAFLLQQQVAATLIAAVLLMLGGAGLFATRPAIGGPALAAPANGSSTVRIDAAPTRMPIKPVGTAPSVPASTATPPATITETHAVVLGDTLWDLAVQYYGDGTRFIDIYQASTATVQADGSRLTDPNLIRPGWVLTVPGVPAPPPPSPAPSHSVTQPESATGSTPTRTHRLAGDGPQSHARKATPPTASSSTPTRAPTPEPAQESSSSDEAVDSGMDLSIPLMTGGGIAGLLAAGLLLVLGRHRLKQRRTRRAGQRLAMPDPQPGGLESRLRMIQEPHSLEHVDHAMRTLQTWAADTGSVLPDLFAIRLEADQIAFYFGAPTRLPDPFVQAHDDQTIWTIRSPDLPTPPPVSLSPYPAVATMGVDRNGGVLLVNLEHLGRLNILGDDALCAGFLNAVAAELASSPWADQIQVTLVGMPGELGRSLNPSRVHHADDVRVMLQNLRHDLDDRRAAFAALDVHGTRKARAAASGTESWAPHVVLVGQPLDPDTARALEALVEDNAELGLVVLSHGLVDGECTTVRVTSAEQAELVLPGGTVPALPFTPQLLQRRELELLQQLVDTTSHPSRPPDPITPAETLQTAEPLDGMAADDPQSGQPTAARSVVTDVALPGPEEPAWAGPPAPYLRLLGPVDILHLGDEAAMPGRGIELVAYLNLNGAVTGRQVQEAFWPDTAQASNNQRRLTKTVRVSLGNSPDGQALLPENIDHHGYRLHPAVRSDWDDFRAQTGGDPAAADTEDLVAALRLVRGQPLTGGNRRRWWHWIAVPEEEMIAAVLDTADELADRALAAHDHATARFAARIAQSVDPLNEAGWRIHLRVVAQTGDQAEFDRVLDDLYTQVGGADPDYEIDQATQDLVDQVTAQDATREKATTR